MFTFFDDGARLVDVQDLGHAADTQKKASGERQLPLFVGSRLPQEWRLDVHPPDDEVE